MSFQLRRAGVLLPPEVLQPLDLLPRWTVLTKVSDVSNCGRDRWLPKSTSIPFIMEPGITTAQPRSTAAAPEGSAHRLCQVGPPATLWDGLPRLLPVRPPPPAAWLRWRTSSPQSTAESSLHETQLKCCGHVRCLQKFLQTATVSCCALFMVDQQHTARSMGRNLSNTVLEQGSDSCSCNSHVWPWGDLENGNLHSEQTGKSRYLRVMPTTQPEGTPWKTPCFISEHRLSTTVLWVLLYTATLNNWFSYICTLL